MAEEITPTKTEESLESEVETTPIEVRIRSSRFSLPNILTAIALGVGSYFGTDKLVDKFKPIPQYPASLSVNQLSELETQTFGKIDEPNFVFGYSSESRRDPQVIVQGRNLTDIRTEKKQEEARSYQERSSTLRNALYK